MRGDVTAADDDVIGSTVANDDVTTPDLVSIIDVIFFCGADVLTVTLPEVGRALGTGTSPIDIVDDVMLIDDDDDDVRLGRLGDVIDRPRSDLAV